MALDAEAHDNIATFYENITSSVKNDGGVYKYDRFSAGEKLIIRRELTAQAKSHHALADHLRARAVED